MRIYHHSNKRNGISLVVAVLWILSLKKYTNGTQCTLQNQLNRNI